MPRQRQGALLLSILCVACSGSATLPEHESIQEFVAAGDLLNAQPPQIMVDIPGFQARLFYSLYGEPTQCMPSTDPPSGPCYSSLAIGFEYRGRIGWLQTQPDDVIPAPQFDFRLNDSELYGAAMATAWRDVDWGSYATIFTPALLRAPSTPRATLLRLANELNEWVSTHSAHLLLQRADVRGDAEILTIVAGLVVRQGDPYAHTREVARGLLDDLATLQGDS